MKRLLFLLLLVIGCQPPTDPGADPIIVDNATNIMFFSESSMFGMMSGTYIMDDGSFMQIDEVGHTMGDGQLCVEGVIPIEDFERLKMIYEDLGFYSTKITQDDDIDLICEGGYSVGVRMDQTETRLMSPCVDQREPETEAGEMIMENITLTIQSMVEEYRSPCKKGYYLTTHDMGDCQTIKEIREQYGGTLEYDEPTEFPERIITNLNYAGAFLRIDDPKSFKEWNKRTYAIGGHCYYVTLLELDGAFSPYEPPIESVIAATELGPKYIKPGEEFVLFGNGTINGVKLKMISISKDRLVVKVLGDKFDEGFMPREGNPTIEITDGYCLWGLGGKYCFDYFEYATIYYLEYNITEG